jgi:hypothetical protein
VTPVRLLLRLYPRGWRRRYGEEFVALLEEVPLGGAVIWDVLRAALLRRLARTDDARAVTRGTGGMQMTETGRPQPPHELTWNWEIGASPWQRRLALLGLVLLLPTLSFLFLVLLKYGMGVPEPFDTTAPFFLNRIVERYTVLAPWIAFVLSTWPTVRFRIGWQHATVTGMLAIHARPLNLLVSALSAAVIAVLVVYFLVENF